MPVPLISRRLAHHKPCPAMLGDYFECLIKRGEIASQLTWHEHW